MAEWAGLGYYARARNLLTCARAVARTGAGFPDTRDGLLALPGIGPYTAAAIAAIAFDRPETVVDGNVERVMARLFAVETPLPAAKPELFALAARLTPAARPGDYAQAMMDLGATICTPRVAGLRHLPVARALRRPVPPGVAGGAAAQGAEAGKAAAPGHRLSGAPRRRRLAAGAAAGRGSAGRHAGLARQRLGRGRRPRTRRLPADWRDPGGEVRHTFTHFHLRLAPARRPGAGDRPARRGGISWPEPIPPGGAAHGDAQGL